MTQAEVVTGTEIINVTQRNIFESVKSLLNWKWYTYGTTKHLVHQLIHTRTSLRIAGLRVGVAPAAVGSSIGGRRSGARPRLRLTSSPASEAARAPSAPRSPHAINWDQTIKGKCYFGGA